MMNTICYLIFTSLLTNKIDTVVLNNSYVVLNNERSCFSCIKPFNTFFKDKKVLEEFRFVSILSEINEFDNFPLLFKNSGRSILCKDTLWIYYLKDDSLLSKTLFTARDRNLPLLMKIKNDGPHFIAFEEICSNNRCKTASIRRRVKRL